MKCGNWEDLFLLKIFENNFQGFPFGETDVKCSIHYFKSSGGNLVPLDDCESRIQLCQNSDDCRPLFDGNTRSNIVFRIGGSETSNDYCPKLILQMNANGYYDKKGIGSHFYVSYGNNSD